MSQTRPTQVTTPKSNKALVTLGETRILSTVTVQVGSMTTSPTGDIVVQLEFPCDLAQPSQSPAAAAAPVQAYIQRILMETIPLDQLSLQHHCPNHTESSIKLGHWAFRLIINLQVLVQDGNLWDSALLAGVAALQNTRLPQLQWNDITNQFAQVSSRQYVPKPLMVPTVPVSLTLGLYKRTKSGKPTTGKPSSTSQSWITDPTLLEESCLTSCLTVVVNAASTNNNKSNEGELLSVEYSGRESVQPTSDFLLAIRMAQARAQEVQRDLLQQSATNTTR